MTKDHDRQGMAELLAKQRSDVPLTPAEAALQRRARQAEQPAAAVPGPLQRAMSRVAGNKIALLTAAAAVAGALAGWLRWSRR